MPEHSKNQSSHYAMGTIFSITVYGADSSHVEECVTQAFEEIDRLDSMMSHYEPESELSIINREAFDRDIIASPELFELLEESLYLNRETAGAFDITVGPLMKSWGFFQRDERVPPQVELLDLIKRTGYRHITLSPATRSIRFDEPRVELDLGAIGKGYAVDRVVAILREKGIDCALVSAGTSSIYALGAPPGQQGWEISICHPRDRRRHACRLRLRDLSVSISGIHDRSFMENGRRYSHILQPESGEPADRMLMSVVVTALATRSDALSTAFFAGGPVLARHYVGRHSATAAILYLPSLEEIVLQSNAEPLPEERFFGLEK